LGPEFAGIDIVISSTAAPHCILHRAQMEVLMKARKNRPLLLIDIAVPRDIDPEIKYLENVYLYNIDDLQEIAAIISGSAKTKSPAARPSSGTRRAPCSSGPGRVRGRFQFCRRQT
jgi:glutamyl-tRNA reductase